MSKAAAEYKDKGNEEFKKGNHGKAIEYYTYATEMDPTNHIFFTNRSNAYFKMKNYDKSLRDANKSVKLNPKWAKGYYRAGLVLMEQDKPQEALALFQQAVDLEPNTQAFVAEVARAKAAFMKGMSQAEILKTDGNEKFKAGKGEDAIKSYTAAIKACKDTEQDQNIKADCYANRAACYRQLYQDEEVIRDASAALEINPNHVKAYIRRAQGYEQMEKYEEALADFQKASQLAPNTPVAFQGASRVRTALKKIGRM